ncbi:bifunctional proline dehydrogenase/L-glutamate gamma-semialdehyde dehydrogenase PutA [Pelagerythrobacter aerophilus]
MIVTHPFAEFAPPIGPASPLREAITAACRRPEPACIAPLLDQARFDSGTKSAISAIAQSLVTALRARPATGIVAALVQEYALSTREGVALMCLAEALLRIPDAETRDALIRDKLGDGDWRAHPGHGRSLFVNAATWNLLLTGKLIAPRHERGLGGVLTRLVARCGTPIVRSAVAAAMRAMGGQFITGETIDAALARARAFEAKGFRYSYDMLGEAAMTAADAARYFGEYERAIHAIGEAADGRGPIAGPGISIKLSALHPRYGRMQARRVFTELLPRVHTLARLAKHYDIGFNIDAEEADRLDLSLDLLERLALEPDLAGWNGLGFVVQAYDKRCPFVIDFLVDLAQRAGRRLMVRLVKGAYWDSEIKRSQIDGLADFPVYTRKAHTDVAYIACAQKLLAAPEAVYPQFATHNAQTLATIYHLAGSDFSGDKYEFQCLHGMGEPLYAQVVGDTGLNRPCRIYAPVGSHDTLLPYLVRRLLENGANSSFVNRLGNHAVPVDDLVSDPVDVISAALQPGAPHDAILLPNDLYGGRRNSEGEDLSDEATLARLGEALRRSAAHRWHAAPIGAAANRSRPVRNPADHRDVVGTVLEARHTDIVGALTSAAESRWRDTPIAERGRCLDRAADLLQERMPILLGLIIREAGKSVANAVAEVREAIDFLRYYAEQAGETLSPNCQPLGTVLCISPWNFPLAIFTGQIAAALVAGNAVIAKPAEETPLIAAEAIRLLHRAGVPQDALHLLPGDGAIGAALVASETVDGVIFTGSTEVARLIQCELATRLSSAGRPIPLIAETGGQNAMIVDSTALAEQVVADVLQSAFDSAGQRCSALRLLCLQDDIATPLLDMLTGAVRELAIGAPDRLSTDVGPVISREAQAAIQRHIAAMRSRGHRVIQAALPPEAHNGSFVPPTIIEIDDVNDLGSEVFGPVLHVLRYRPNELDRLIDAINATGYGLTFGVHSRLDSMAARVTTRARAGNLYVNRNIVGAVVGVQPFGGRGLSGTGPKAGGPLYLRRLIDPARALPRRNSPPDPALLAFGKWLDAIGECEAAHRARLYGEISPLGTELDLPGPVGEHNRYCLRAKGTILAHPTTPRGLFEQTAAILATGNHALIEAPPSLAALLHGAPKIVRDRLCHDLDHVSAALIEGDRSVAQSTLADLAMRPGPIVLAQIALPKTTEDLAYDPSWLVEEISISTNLAAAGGNASLMAIA